MPRLCVFAEETSLPRPTNRGWKPLPQERWHRGAGWSPKQSASEPLPSFAHRKAPQAFHQDPAARPGLALHYQWCDYASLQSRSPCHDPPIAAGSRSHKSAGTGGAGRSPKQSASEPLPTPRSSAKPPELWTTTPHEGQASPYTINPATMRLCGGDLPAWRERRSRVVCPESFFPPSARRRRQKSGHGSWSPAPWPAADHSDPPWITAASSSSTVHPGTIRISFW